MRQYYGLMKGEIAGVADPEERFRYRVRVYQLHSQEIPADHLPFASALCFVGDGFGDVPNYQVGDKVVVAFENGNRDHPIIVGAVVTARKEGSAFVPKFPKDQSEPYATRQRRWERGDRDGNMIRTEEGTDGPDHVSFEIQAKNKLRVTTEDGHLELEVNGDGSVTLQGGLQINVQGDASIAVQGQAQIQSADVRLGTAPTERVVTEARLAQAFNTHIHGTPAGPSDPPNVPLVPDDPSGVGSPEVRAT